MNSSMRNHMEETFFTVLIWIGIWGIASRMISMYCTTLICEILMYLFLIIFGYYALYVRKHIM